MPTLFPLQAGKETAGVRGRGQGLLQTALVADRKDPGTVGLDEIPLEDPQGRSDVAPPSVCAELFVGLIVGVRHGREK